MYSISPKCVFLENGSMALLSNIFHKIATKNNKVMLGIGPQFYDVVTEWEVSGGEYIPSENFEDLLNNISLYPESLIYIDNPNNPTGYIYDREELISVLEKCKENKSILVVDEAYGDYLDDSESMIKLTETFNNLIVVRSFSKGLGLASIRLGYAIVNSDLIPLFNSSIIPFCVPISSLKIASIALDSVDNFLRDSVNRTIQTKEKILCAIRECGIEVFPTSKKTPIFLVKCKDVDAEKYFRNLGIKVTPAKGFKKTYKYIDNQFCRIRIPNNGHNLDEFIRRIKLN